MSTVTFESLAGVGLVTLNRPEQLNALDLDVRHDIDEVLARVRADSAIRAVVLTGAGRAFCAGGDVRSMPSGPGAAEAGRRRLADHTQWLEALIGLDRPVVAAVNGAAYGAGFSLALAADFVIAADNARFCASFPRLGLVPDCGAHWLLPRVVGMQRAREILFTTRELGAVEAHELGIALQVVEAATLVDRAVAFARGFCEASPMSMALSKEILRSAWTADLHTVLGMEASAQGIAFSTDYHQAAATRFRAREAQPFPPVGWSGRGATRDAPTRPPDAPSVPGGAR
jgi:2-(1,2-epoxy-1,2-dihydrophenyl)acetyl-CoA isomerase